MRSGRTVALRHYDRDLVAILVAVQRNVCAVGELQAQRVLTRLQVEGRGQLSLAEVDHGVGREDDFSGFHELLVDEDVHVAGTFAYLAGGVN